MKGFTNAGEGKERAHVINPEVKLKAYVPENTA